MRKRLLLTVFTLMGCCTAAWADVLVNEANFPDENFRNCLLSDGYGQDGVLTDTEIAFVEYLDVREKNIKSLKGIEHFTALGTLLCNDNQLTELDVSKNTELAMLWCYNNQLTALDVSKNTALIALSCDNNQLTALDVSACSRLAMLNCYVNRLTSLRLPDSKSLEYLDCGTNQLRGLDVSSYKKLHTFYCRDNQLNYLEVWGCSALEVFYCFGNQLTTLDMSGCTALTEFGCSDNRLYTLYLPPCPNLMWLNCGSNQLSRLDVVLCPALTRLYCYDNKFSGIYMDQFIKNLPEREDGEAYVFLYVENYEDAGLTAPDGNVCTAAHVAAAKAKGWVPCAYNGEYWYRYPGIDDVDGISSPTPGPSPNGGEVYDLSGRRGGKPQLRLYIYNGKKVALK